jgi:NTE family protein
MPLRAALGEMPADDSPRPRIGLALSGGGARGAAHIGVLRVLEKYRIPIDYIAGTSMGAIVGGLYASGMSVQELEGLISEVDWADAFVDEIARKDRSFRRKRDDDLYLVRFKPGLSEGKLKLPAGALDGHKIDLLLKRYTLPVVTVRDFDQLGIPFRAVASDLVTGKPVVMDHGDLALTMRASMSIPVVFLPVEMDGRLLVDGGVTSNLPIDVVRDMGADIVIAVDISTPLQERDEIQSVLSVTNQITTILTRRNTDKQIASLTDQDIFIRPDLEGISTSSFERAADAVPAGVRAAEDVADAMARLSVTTEDYRAHMAGRVVERSHPVIDAIKIENHSRLADSVVAKRLHVELGTPLDVDRLERDLGHVYGLELFESAYYDITAEADRTVLLVRLREAKWGPDHLQFGIAIFEEYESANFNLAAAYTRTAVNRLSGEWRTGAQIGREPGVFTELYQPIDYRLRKFVHVLAFYADRAVSVFVGKGHKVTEWGTTTFGIRAALGREIGTWAEVRAGLIRESGTARVQVGDPTIPDTTFQTGEAFVQFYADELDDVAFPRSGGTLRARGTFGLQELGSDADYSQGTVDGSYVRSWGRHSLLLGGRFATTFSQDAPLQSQYTLGGFTQLSGLEQDELRGQHSALLYAAYYRRLWDFKLLPGYAGVSLEYGNVFECRDDIRFDNGRIAGSVFLGLDTMIGPAYLAYGRAEGDRWSLYLFLGQSISKRRSGYLGW